MAALGRIYAEARDGPPTGRATPMVFWFAIGAAALVKGPVAPMVATLAMLGLTIADRRPGWLRRLNWYWGLLLVLIIVGPWAGAVTVATDGVFWSKSVAGDMAPKLVGGHETHGAPPGFHTLLAPLLLFPATLLLPAALVAAWRRRREPGVRFALAWLIPTWLIFEIAPTKLVHYTLPTFGAICWLAAAAAVEPVGKGAKILGAVLASISGLFIAALALYLTSRFGTGAGAAWAVLASVLLAAAGVGGAYILLRAETPLPAIAAAVGFGLLSHAALAAGLAPRLDALWLSRRIEAAMGKAQLLPRQGIADAPVAVAGYAEPSLVFALGTETELVGPQTAAEAIAEHRPAVVEAREEAAFRQALARLRAAAQAVAEVKGLNYSTGHEMTLRIYRATDTEATQGGQP
jgi:4-amino-4-deoxy-L-arabinose transferase-like glycosyltransferase